MQSFKPKTRIIEEEFNNGEKIYYPQYKVGFFGFWSYLYYNELYNRYNTDLTGIMLSTTFVKVKFSTIEKCQKQLDHFISHKNEILNKEHNNKVKTRTIINGNF